MSLRARLTIGTVSTLALAICVGLGAAYFAVRDQLRGEIDNALRGGATALAMLTSRTLRSASAPGGQNIAVPPVGLGGPPGYIQLVDRRGHVSLLAGEGAKLPIDGARAVASGDRSPFYTDATVGGTHVRIYVRPVGGRAAEIARPLTEVDHSLARIRLLFLLVSLAAVAGAAASRMAVARATLRPVRRRTHDANASPPPATCASGRTNGGLMNWVDSHARSTRCSTRCRGRSARSVSSSPTRPMSYARRSRPHAPTSSSWS